MENLLLAYSAYKQPTRIKKTRLQDATDLQQIAANEASGAGSLPVIEKAWCKMQQICNITSIGNKGHHHRCFTRWSAESQSPSPGSRDALCSVHQAGVQRAAALCQGFRGAPAASLKGSAEGGSPLPGFQGCPLLLRLRGCGWG